MNFAHKTSTQANTKCIKLSPRLNCIYNRLKPNEQVWDLCCDHGYIGLKAYQCENFSEIIFVDQVEDILNDLHQRFDREFFNNKNQTKVNFLAMNAQNVEIPLSGNIILAGVGTETILKILNALDDRGLIQAERILIAPQNHPKALVEFMQKKFSGIYDLVEQQVILENHRHRHIFIFDNIIGNY